MDVIVKMIPKKYLSKNVVPNVVRYIYKGAKQLPEHEQIIGSWGLFNGDDPETAIQEMMQTKKLFDAEDGVQLKHIVISFGKKPDLPRKKMRRLILRTIGIWKERYQMFFGVHYHENEEGNPNYHVHVMVNTINMKTGSKMDMDVSDWYRFCKRTKRLWRNAIEESQKSRTGE